MNISFAKKIIIIALLVYIGIQSYCIHRLSVNYDEGQFAAYGASLMKLQGDKDVAKFDSKLPITALNLIPRAAEQIIHPNLSKSESYSDVISGRYISLIIAVLLAIVIYRWSALLYGTAAGLFSFFLFLICPNFLAHGIFVSSDIFACLFTTCSLFFLWQFGQSGYARHFVWGSVCVGLAEISKFSMLHLIVLYVLLLGSIFLYNRRETGFGFTLKKFIGLIFVFGVINWVIINAAHLFYGIFVPLGDYQFRSGFFIRLQSFFLQAGFNWRMPFSSSYIKSLDAVMYFDHLGGGMPNSLNGATYLLGKNKTNGFWYYYFVVLFYKMPLTTLLLLSGTLFCYIRSVTIAQFIKKEMFLLVPVVYYLIYMDFFYSTQIGIRHIMIIFPLLYIFAGFFFQLVTPKFKYVLYGLVAYQLISVSFYFPHFLPYTNECITNKKMAYKKIADTNICYGEGEQFLHSYQLLHPDAIFMPTQIIPGKIIMEVNEMLDLDIGTMGKYDWTKYFIPVDHIDSQFLIFDISKDQADSLKKTRF